MTISTGRRLLATFITLACAVAVEFTVAAQVVSPNGKVELLGYGKIKARQTAEGLEVQLPAPTNDIAPVLKIAK